VLFPPSLTIFLPSVCLTFALCLVLCCAGTAVLCVALTKTKQKDQGSNLENDKDPKEKTNKNPDKGKSNPKIRKRPTRKTRAESRKRKTEIKTKAGKEPKAGKELKKKRERKDDQNSKPKVKFDWRNRRWNLNQRSIKTSIDDFSTFNLSFQLMT
jgi:hypothetical protein